MAKNLDNETLKLLLRRGVSEIIVEDELMQLLESGRKLRLKQGFDPSRPDIHLGHVVGLKKLRQFQELGHEVILIVGDWTAQIGDPSGMSQTRPMLSAEEVRANAETYMKQFFKVVDREKTKVVWQSEWFGDFSLADVIKLTSKFTVAQMLQRDDFSSRYAANRPIAITEFLYPLLQAYDSVMIESDVEFGGTDQKFNCLVGRELQQMEGQPPQQVFLMPILAGTDGKMKMSKSLDNCIAIDEPPGDMYGKILSIPDSLIMDYFELLTDVPDDELTIFSAALKNESVNPMILKKRLARELVTEFHGKQAAQEAERNFEKVVQQREVPEEIEEHLISFEELKLRSLHDASVTLKAGDIEAAEEATVIELGHRENGEPIMEHVRVTVPYLLYDELGLVLSRSEAKRLLSQGAVEIDGKKVTGDVVSIRDGSIVKVGKRRFKKIVNADSQMIEVAGEQPQKVNNREGLPDKIDVRIRDNGQAGRPRDIAQWLVDNRLVKNAGEVERLISRGEILIIRDNGNRYTVSESIVTILPGDIVKYGKRRFAKIVDYGDESVAEGQDVEETRRPEEPGIFEYCISFRELEDEALLAAARESRASDLAALKDALATDTEPGKGARRCLAVTIPFILCKTGLATTNREAKRLLSRGVIEIDGNTISKDTTTIKDGSIIVTGEGRCVKIVDSDNKS
jgi:tyrosyl-tRNA synthetase